MTCTNYLMCKTCLLSQDGANPGTFSVIDLASSFNHFLDEESFELLTLNTQKVSFYSSDCVLV